MQRVSLEKLSLNFSFSLIIFIVNYYCILKGYPMETKKCNWAVVVETKNSISLKGIYPTKRAAEFICKRVKFNEKLKDYPKVIETENDLYPENNKVEEWLQAMDRKKDFRQRSKYLPKKHRPMSK
tara:strand:- start:39348 stop:39722 length:375 start_codon:yes stop_codon:yes gene_type:complete